MAAVLADLVDRTYVRVIESGCGLGFSQQALSGALIGRDFRGQKFDCDFPVEPLVLRQVNLAHAAAPKLRDDAIVRDGLADQGCES